MPKKKRAAKKEDPKDDLTALLEMDEDTGSPKEPEESVGSMIEESAEDAIPAEIVPAEASPATPTPEKPPVEPLPDLPSSYEIEYRTRVRFPVPEILSAAAER